MKNTVLIVKKTISKNGEFLVLDAEVVIKRGKNKIIDFPISARYVSESGLRDKINALIGAEWDKYQECQAALKSDGLADAVSGSAAQAEKYINGGTEK